MHIIIYTIFIISHMVVVQYLLLALGLNRGVIAARLGGMFDCWRFVVNTRARKNE